MSRSFLSLDHASGPPCDTWHRPSTRGEFCTVDVLHFLDISQPTLAIGWERSAIQLPRSDMSGSVGNAYPEYIHGRQFRFPEQLDSLDIRYLPDPFLPTVKKVTLTTLLTKSLKSSLIFNARRAWWDIHKSSQVTWRIAHTENHKLRWQTPPEHPSDSRHFASERSWLLRHPMSRNHDHGTR